MCGIAGIFDLREKRPIDRDALERMTNALAHRGPDGSGYFVEDGIGLGHRRLAIIDLEGGMQPFQSQNGDCVIAFNGEIYNFQDLKQSEFAKADNFKTDSDTEVLTELWAQRQERALDALNGMFAIAAWDKKSRILTLSRDRLGEKPLYYGVSRDGFLLFASEVNALLASGMIDAELSQQAVLDYFHYGYVPDPLSIYKNIFKLPAAHFIKASADADLTPREYWTPISGEKFQGSYDEAVEHLQSLVDETVRRQMVSDVPLGAFLSGGVDSSGIVAAMANANNGPVKTTTIGFEDADFDERAYAAQVASRYETDHREEVLNFSVMDMVPQIAKTFGEPFADSSAFPSFLVSQKTREHVTVALSGDGGDELFAGYRRYPFFLKEEKIRGLLPFAIRKTIFGSLAALYPNLDNAPRPLRLRSAFRSLSENMAQSYFRSVAVNRPEFAKHLLDAEVASTEHMSCSLDYITTNIESTKDTSVLTTVQYADLKTWLSGRMLVKVDRTSMANSLEVRPPLLDYRMVEWAFTLPDAFKLQGHNGKRVLKSAFEPRVPEDILYRPKQGFGSPISKWLRLKENNPLSTLLDSSAWKDAGVFDENYAEKIIREHRSGAREWGQEIWSLIMFNAFLEQRP